MEAQLQLFDAVLRSDSSSIRTLIDRNVSPLWKNPNQKNQTALDIALQIQSPECLELVLRTSITTAAKEKTSTLDLATILSRKITSTFCGIEDSEMKEGETNGASIDVDESQAIYRVERCIDSIRNGKCVIVQDDFDRENEGDLIFACEKATAEIVAFTVNETSGVICAALTDKRCIELELPPMVKVNTERHCTAFTASVDYKHGTSTGISAADRAATIRALVSESSKPDDFSRPGHIFPLRARTGGIMTRSGHTETAVTLAKLAGLKPGGAICEIVNRDGSMKRTAGLMKFSKKHEIPFMSILDLKEYLKQKGIDGNLYAPLNVSGGKKIHRNGTENEIVNKRQKIEC